MRGEDLARQSCDYITTALLDLMKKKPYRSITVKEIAERAGVARLTFYRNFTDKEDVLRAYLNRLFLRYMEELDTAETLVEALERCFSDWKEKGEFSELLVRNGLESILFQPFREYVEAVLKRYRLSDRLTESQKEFLVGGLFFSMLSWVQNDEKISARESAEQILSVLCIPEPEKTPESEKSE